MKDLSEHLLSIENIHCEQDYLIVLKTNEFSCYCPETLAAEFGIITVSYIPNEKMIEMLSFDKYIYQYRQVEEYSENTLHQMKQDIVKKIQPKYLEMHGIFYGQFGSIVETMLIYVGDMKYQNYRNIQNTQERRLFDMMNQTIQTKK